MSGGGGRRSAWPVDSGAGSLRSRTPIPAELPAPAHPGWPWVRVEPAPSAGPDGPLVSIITPSLNHGRFIEAAIRSVLLQDYPHIEYIVVDGGSTDGTVDILKRYTPWITAWMSEPDRGQAHAINKGLALARGEFVAWLNTDDFYLPGAVRAAVDILRARQDVIMVYGEVYVANTDGQRLWLEPGRRFTRERALVMNPVLQPAAFMRAEAVRGAGALDESLHFLLDLDLWLRLFERGPLLRWPKPWAAARIHADSKTARCQPVQWEEQVQLATTAFRDRGWVEYSHWFAAMAWRAAGAGDKGERHAQAARRLCPRCAKLPARWPGRCRIARMAAARFWAQKAVLRRLVWVERLRWGSRALVASPRLSVELACWKWRKLAGTLWGPAP